MARPPAPTCIFCGERRKMSKEHVIPQWVSKELAKDPRELLTPIRVFIDGQPSRQMASSRVIDTWLSACAESATRDGWRRGLSARCSRC